MISNPRRGKVEMKIERPTWPVPWPPEMFATYRPELELNLSTLPPEAKRAIWLKLQREQPDLAALLKQPDFRALVEAFDADVLIEINNK